MSVKTGFSLALVLALLGSSTGWAQELPGPPLNDPKRIAPHAAPGEIPAQAQGAPAGPSGWMTYTAPDCCGPFGGGPVLMEVYMRNGASVPVGGRVFGDGLDVGWMFQGGGRSLFFNPEQDKAWTLDLNITNIAQTANRNASGIPMNVLVPRPSDPNNPNNNNPMINGQSLDPIFLSPPYPADAAIPIRFGTDPRFPGLTVSSLNRTFVGAGIGREWYLNGSANNGCRLWRAGFDAGGRFGTAKANFKEIPHRTDAISGVFAGFHTDMEIPWGCCKLILGARAEWDYTWTEALLQPQNDGEFTSLNFSLTTGVRY